VLLVACGADTGAAFMQKTTPDGVQGSNAPSQRHRPFSMSVQATICSFVVYSLYSSCR